MPADWDLLTTAFLHDPPDKALDIRGHERRAGRYLEAALGRPVDVASIKQEAGLADRLAAIAERLPMPTAGRDGERAVAVENGTLQVHHPLGGASRRVKAPALDPTRVEGIIRELVNGIDQPSLRHLALWRLLPERLAELDPAYALLPADTRVPDHTIWHHADTATALLPADTGSGASFLSFALAPVQTFIAAARSLRDLWSGSLILSWLTFEALLPVIEDLGPAAVIFPYLRGNPMLDVWLRRQPALDRLIREPDQSARAAPSLPNRFLAVVPTGSGGQEAQALARRCEGAAQQAWREMAAEVRKQLTPAASRWPGWDALWDTQIDEFWEARSAVLPYRSISDDDLARVTGNKDFGETWPDAGRIRELATMIPATHRPGYDQQSAGRWQATVELAARALEARRAIRHVPRNSVTLAHVPQKCALLGTVERMGPAEFGGSTTFFEDLRKFSSFGVRLRPREYFSAVALTKRFAYPAKLADALGLHRHRPFPDTAVVAARLWLERSDLLGAITDHGNGQCLHWRSPDQGAKDEEGTVPDTVWSRIVNARKESRPPAYLAVLVMDGDNMGAWLRGDMSPSLETALHPSMREYFLRLGAAGHLKAKRPVSPALHGAISEALTNFASRIAPAIIARHHGELIYAGGDDLLALLPTETAIACASALEGAFRGVGSPGSVPEGYWRESTEEVRDRLAMGPRATTSAGIAVVHHKEDLRAALAYARAAESAAKQGEGGRNRLHLFIARRSGERVGVSLGWSECSTMSEAVEKFVAVASDRWLYKLRALVQALPNGAFDVELKRQLGRSDPDTSKALNGLVERNAFHAPGRSPEEVVTLWQAAGFLARGRDEGGEDA